jgi:erythromycin esterase
LKEEDDLQYLENSVHLDPLLEQIGKNNVQYVLLGEASHDTSEFYSWRSEITKRLIKEKGFSFIAVEGDWPDCYSMNCYRVVHTMFYILSIDGLPGCGPIC